MSGILIEELGRDPSQIFGWDSYVSAHPDGTIYHLSAWRTIFERSFGYRSWLLIAKDGASSKIAGALPLYLVAAPFSRRLVSVPFRDRGGPLWDTPDIFDALVSEARKVALAAKAGSILLKTVRPYAKALTGANSLQEHFYWVHSAIDLRGVIARGVWKEIGDKNRNMIRQAERQGLACELLPVNEETIRKWHRLHLATQKRLGIPPFPLVFFMTMAEELRNVGGITMFGVHRHDRMVASTIVLLHSNTAIYGYSASDREGQQHRANDLMLFTVIRWLIDREYHTFDLGSDSPLQETLLFFKRKWMAAQMPIPVYASEGDDRVVIDSSEERYDFARKLLSLLPTRILDMTGSAITRYFG